MVLLTVKKTFNGQHFENIQAVLNFFEFLSQKWFSSLHTGCLQNELLISFLHGKITLKCYFIIYWISNKDILYIEVKTPYLERRSLSHSFSSAVVTALSSFLSEFCPQISSATTGGDSTPPWSSAVSSFHSTDCLGEKLGYFLIKPTWLILVLYF